MFRKKEKSSKGFLYITGQTVRVQVHRPFFLDYPKELARPGVCQFPLIDPSLNTVAKKYDVVVCLRLISYFRFCNRSTDLICVWEQYLCSIVNYIASALFFEANRVF